MSQTPIYDQLRRERINADVPAAEADPEVEQVVQAAVNAARQAKATARLGGQEYPAGQPSRQPSARASRSCPTPVARHSSPAQNAAAFSWFGQPSLN
jgi:hypothetical protein